MVEIFTTAGVRRSAKSAKLSGLSAAEAMPYRIIAIIPIAANPTLIMRSAALCGRDTVVAATASLSLLVEEFVMNAISFCSTLLHVQKGQTDIT